MPPGFGVSIAETDDALILALRGELDVASVDSLRDAVDQAERSTQPAIVVDLRALEFIDSIGIRELMRLHRRAKETGRDLSLSPGGRQVQRTFQIAGLLDVLPFTTT